MAVGSTQPLVKMSTRNIPGGKGGRCVRLTTSPPSCAECHKIWEPKPPGTLSATSGLLRESFTFTFLHTAGIHDVLHKVRQTSECCCEVTLSLKYCINICLVINHYAATSTLMYLYCCNQEFYNMNDISYGTTERRVTCHLTPLHKISIKSETTV